MVDPPLRPPQPRLESLFAARLELALVPDAGGELEGVHLAQVGLQVDDANL